MPAIIRQKDLRRAFWLDHEPLRLAHRAGRRAKPHNAYPADVRIAFGDYVDAAARAGTISERLARRATL